MILALSQDAQSQLGTDPLRKHFLGIAGGAVATFTTTFQDITTAKVYNGVTELTTGWTLSNRTGPDGEDQIVFAAAPVSGTFYLTVDKRALNLTVIDAAILAASDTIARYLPTGTDVTSTWLLAVLKPIAIRLAKAQLRERRELGVSDALDLLVKADLEWLRSVRDAKALLPVLPSGGDSSPSEVRADSEPDVFGPLGASEESAFS